ncbi:15636_t:CDS:2, partial [Dentiscutata heterogama]
QATQLAPEFYNKLITEIREKIWIPTQTPTTSQIQITNTYITA